LHSNGTDIDGGVGDARLAALVGGADLAWNETVG
jgi:hypothetical protein